MAKDVFSLEPNCDVLRSALGIVAGCKAFLVWRAYPREGGGFDKMPIDPSTGLPSTVDNSALARGCLTFEEARAACESLAAEDLPVGIGITPANTNGMLTAVDLDRVIDQAGKIDTWAATVADGSTYCEVSPSGTGIRVLTLDAGPELGQRASGFERAEVGLYGAVCRKFVTLTGAILPGAAQELRPMSDASRQAIWNRWEAERAKKGLPSAKQFTSMFPGGEEGMAEMLACIRSGASFHPATIAYVSTAVNFNMSLQAIEEDLVAAYLGSEQRNTDRWHQRYPTSINGAMAWIRKKSKERGAQSGVNPLLDIPTQVIDAKRKKAQEAMRGVVERLGGPTRIFGDVTPQEAPAAPTEDEKQAELDALHAALAQEEEKADFSLITDCPPGAFKRLVEYGYECLDHDLPELALMTAMAAVGACAPGYVVESKRHYTALNSYLMALVPSGIGKSHVEKAIMPFVNRTGTQRSGLPNSAEGIHRAAIDAEAHPEVVSDGRGKGSACAVLFKDEIAGWLAKAEQGKGSEAGALEMLLSLFNRGVGSAAMIDPATRADAKASRKRVNNPYFSVISFATVDRYTAVLTDEMLSSGWGNRNLHFIMDYGEPKKRSILRARPDRLPDDLIAVARQFRIGCNAADGTPQGVRAGFWRSGEDWHRWCRVLELSEEAQVMAEARETALKAKFRENDYNDALPNRLIENAYKLAGQISLMDHADQAVMMEAWPEGTLKVQDAHVAYALLAVERLLTRFAKLWAGSSANSQEARDGRKIEGIIKKALKNPQVAKYRKHWVGAIQKGWVPGPYIKYRFGGKDAADKALNFLCDTDALTDSTAKEAGLQGLDGSTRVYRLKWDR